MTHFTARSVKVRPALGGLTARQREIIDFIRARIMDSGRPPTMREASAHFGWSSHGAIRCHLLALERKGLLRWDRREARGLRLTVGAGAGGGPGGQNGRGGGDANPKNQRNGNRHSGSGGWRSDGEAEGVLLIPMVGSVPAGLPAEALPEPDETFAIPRHLFPAPGELFALRVRGDSMIGAGIMPGDRLIVRRAIEAPAGRIVVANIDGETTVKRLLLRRRLPVLRPENPAYPDITPQPGQEWRIEGLVVGMFRMM